jgi:hypothetical protein
MLNKKINNLNFSKYKVHVKLLNLTVGLALGLTTVGKFEENWFFSLFTTLALFYCALFCVNTLFCDVYELK